MYLVKDNFRIFSSSGPIQKIFILFLIDFAEAAQVRKEYDDSSSKLSKMQSRISSLTQKLKQDFGKLKLLRKHVFIVDYIYFSVHLYRRLIFSVYYCRSRKGILCVSRSMFREQTEQVRHFLSFFFNCLH